MPIIANLQSAKLLDSETATVISVTADATVQTILAANDRGGGLLYNDTDKACYVKFGTGASSTSFTAKLAPKDADGIGGYLSLGALRVYQGVVTAIWDASPTGAMRATEFPA